MLGSKPDRTSRKSHTIKHPSSHSIRSFQKTVYVFSIHPAVLGSQYCPVCGGQPHVLNWWLVEKVESFEGTIAISVGPGSLSSSPKLRFPRMFQLQTLLYNLLILRNVRQVVTPFLLEVLAVVLLNQSLSSWGQPWTSHLPHHLVD